MKSPGSPLPLAPAWLDTLRLGVRLTRIEKPLCATLFTFLGAHLVAPLHALCSPPVLIAAVCVCCITAFGFVINDCFDLAVDTIGKPDRPLPAGGVSRRAALRLAWTLAAAGLLLGALLGGTAALFAAGAVALSAAYSYRLKSTLLLGNITVALLVAGVLVFGAVVAGAATQVVWTAALITFNYIVAQEALFTLDDEDEDRAAGLHTTATILGTARCARLVRALLILFAIVALAPWVAGRASTLYATALCSMALAPAALLWWWLREPVQPARIARAVKVSRLLWVTSFVPLALLK